MLWSVATRSSSTIKCVTILLEMISQINPKLSVVMEKVAARLSGRWLLVSSALDKLHLAPDELPDEHLSEVGLLLSVGVVLQGGGGGGRGGGWVWHQVGGEPAPAQGYYYCHEL